jgi:hypothetical protein
VAVNGIYASIIPSYKYNLVLKSFSYGTQVMGHPVQCKSTENISDDHYFNQISTSATIFHCVHCRQHKLKLRVGHVSIELLTKVVTKSPRLQN